MTQSLTGKLSLLMKILRRDGWRLALAEALRKALGVPSEIWRVRNAVTRRLHQLYGTRVAHGAFAGMDLSDTVWWDANNAAGKILGSYERQTTERLVAVSDPEGLLIDIGAGNGYFAIGCLHAGLFARAIGFEQAPEGQAQLRDNARLNGVSDRVRIEGTADSAALLAVLETEQPSAILCDIEGAEFGLFNDAVLARLAGVPMIIEVHPIYVPEGQTALEDLIARAAPLFDSEIIGPADPEISRFPELADLRDDHRLLAFSEERPESGQWLVLTPRAAAGEQTGGREP